MLDQLNRKCIKRSETYGGKYENVDRVKEIANTRIVMDQEISIPVGDSYKGELMEYLQNCSVGKSGGRSKC